MRPKVLKLVVVLVVIGILGGGAWLAINGSGLVQPAHWAAPAQAVPVISTRGMVKDGQLSHDPAELAYRVEGNLPGLGAGACPADLLIVIHGFNNTADKAVYKFAIAQEGLARSGYQGALAGYSWDADTQKDPLAMTGYHEGMRNAEANGVLLARFIADYKQHCPQTRLHLLGYSMGARLALEGLLALDSAEPAPAAPLVASVHLVGAAVKSDEVELGQRYGQAIADQAGVLINYYSPEDNKLGYYFPLKEGGRALGVTDVEHPELKPGNYTAIDATRELPKYTSAGAIDEEEYGDNHSAYLGTRDAQERLVDDGVMNLVAAQIAELAAGARAPH